MMRSITFFLEGKASGLRMPWVAELTAEHPRFKFEREFLDWSKDYEHANSRGSRGVRAIYILETGKVYEVFEKTSWKSSHRYFCRVTPEGDIVKITADEVLTHIAHHELDHTIVPSLKADAGDERP